MGVVLTALLFRRLLSRLSIEQPVLVSFAISLVVLAIPWVILERRARRMAPGSLLAASWQQLSVFAASGFDSVPTVRGRWALTGRKAVILGMGSSPAELTWPKLIPRRSQLVLPIGDDVLVRFHVTGDRVAKVEFQRGEHRFTSPATGRLRPLPPGAIRQPSTD